MNILRRRGVVVAATGIVALALLAVPAEAHRTPGPRPPDRAHYILPPGNYGGLPTTDELARPAPALRRR